MNQRVAKRIRKMVYGDQSIRVQDYGVLQIPSRRGRITGQLVCRGLREKYRAAKKFYQAMKRAGKPSPFLFKEGFHADQKYNPHTGKEEYCLVSIIPARSSNGTGRRSRATRRSKNPKPGFNWFKHKGNAGK